MNTIRLHELLGLRDLPSSGLAWNDLLLERLEQKALRVLARHLGVTTTDLTDLVLDAPLEEGARLPRHASDFMYRIARALRQLETAKGGDVEAAALWLRSVQPELKGRIPILLLQTSVGTEYVMTAIGRMKPPVVLADENVDSGVADPEAGDGEQPDTPDERDTPAS